MAHWEIPLGRLRGGLFWHGPNGSISLPSVFSLLLSLVLSMVLYVFDRIRR